MRRLCYAAVLAVLLTSVARAGSIPIYQSTANQFESDDSYALDDGNFNPPGITKPTTVNCITFGFVVPVMKTDTTVTISFYDTMTLNGGAGNPVNTVLLGSVTATYMGETMGTKIKTIMMANGITFPDNDWGVVMRYTRPGTNNINPDSTILFAGGPVAIGSNADQFWEDANKNNIFEGPAERRTFISPPPNFPPVRRSFTSCSRPCRNRRAGCCW